MRYTETLKWIDKRCGVENEYPATHTIAELPNYKEYTDIYIGDLIAENRDNRFVVLSDTEYEKIWRDTHTDRIFCLEKICVDKPEIHERTWHELYLASCMGKDYFENDRFVSKADMDDFYEFICDCAYSCTITHNGIEYILWFGNYQREIEYIGEYGYDDIDWMKIPKEPAKDDNPEDYDPDDCLPF